MISVSQRKCNVFATKPRVAVGHNRRHRDVTVMQRMAEALNFGHGCHVWVFYHVKTTYEQEWTRLRIDPGLCLEGVLTLAYL